MLNANGYDEKGISAFERIKTYLMINMQTITDISESHIAKMLIIGSTMGIVEATQDTRKYKDAEKDILKLVEKLLDFEEENVKELKKFL